jgi:hypothetical protein
MLASIIICFACSSLTGQTQRDMSRGTIINSLIHSGCFQRGPGMNDKVNLILFAKRRGEWAEDL